MSARKIAEIAESELRLEPRRTRSVARIANVTPTSGPAERARVAKDARSATPKASAADILSRAEISAADIQKLPKRGAAVLAAESDGSTSAPSDLGRAAKSPRRSRQTQPASPERLAGRDETDGPSTPRVLRARRGSTVASPGVEVLSLDPVRPSTAEKQRPTSSGSSEGPVANVQSTTPKRGRPPKSGPKTPTREPSKSPSRPATRSRTPTRSKVESAEPVMNRVSPRRAGAIASIAQEAPHPVLAVESEATTPMRRGRNRQAASATPMTNKAIQLATPATALRLRTPPRPTRTPARASVQPSAMSDAEESSRMAKSPRGRKPKSSVTPSKVTEEPLPARRTRSMKISSADSL